MPNRPIDPALDSTVAPSKPDALAGTQTGPSGAPPTAGTMALRPGVVVAETNEITRERSMKPFVVGVGICVLLAVGALLYKQHLQTAHDEAVAASATPTPTPAITTTPPATTTPTASPAGDEGVRAPQNR